MGHRRSRRGQCQRCRMGSAAVFTEWGETWGYGRGISQGNDERDRVVARERQTDPP